MHDTTDLPEIRAFVALADTGSFAAASRLLNRDATVLSRRLQVLENRLGVRLAERTTRRVSVTEAGYAYLARVRPLLQELDEAGRDAASIVPGEPRGRLKVALPHAIDQPWFTSILIGFMREYPRVRLAAAHFRRRVDLVGEGYDIAVALEEPRDPLLTARNIGTVRRLVCASPDYLDRHPAPANPEDLLSHACLAAADEQGPSRWEFRRPNGRTIAINPVPTLVSDAPQLLTTAAVAGMGLFYTTDWQAGPALASGRLVEVLAHWAPSDGEPVFALMSAEAGSTNKVQAFAEWLATAIAGRPWLQSPPMTNDPSVP